MEKLKIDAEPGLQLEKRWELIPEANLVALPELWLQFSIALNDNEILILGGHGYREPNVQLYDTRTDSCSSVAANGAFAFYK